MRKNRTRKTSTFTVRVPEKLRFAVDLLCERHQASLSTVVTRAVEDLAEKENLTTRSAGEMLSLLDRLYDPSEYQRLVNLMKFAPELLSEIDKKVLNQIADDTLFEDNPDPAILDAEVIRLRKELSGS